ncbi:MAG: hypothetical protein OEU76_07100 [Cyclobacteriaceae bacterium]|nr:hypothetical protein [Cyclobacteriaceae bacterium]
MKPFLLICITATICFSQEKPIKVIPLTVAVKQAYVDRPGDLYIEFAFGAIQKFDVDGKLIKEYTPPEKLSLFEPRDGARAFSYSKKSNWYSYSFFGSLSKKTINPEFAINPVLACSSGDKNLWVLDKADISLKKLNTDRSTIDVEFRLPEQFHTTNIEEITMREYQNFLFVLDPHSGLYIFNAIGILIKTLEVRGISYFNFLGEELYYPDNGKLIFYDLFDTKTREITLDPKVIFVLMTDLRIYKVYPDRAEILIVHP